MATGQNVCNEFRGVAKRMASDSVAMRMDSDSVAFRQPKGCGQKKFCRGLREHSLEDSYSEVN